MTITRAALRHAAEAVLREELGAVSITRLCPRCGSAEHGRPFVHVGSGSAPWVSIAYAGTLAAVAWSRSGPVGIDIEEVGPAVDGRSRREWTRLEALLKATGDGLAKGPSDLPVAPTTVLALPDGWVGTFAGQDVNWRLAGPAAPSGPATR